MPSKKKNPAEPKAKAAPAKRLPMSESPAGRAKAKAAATKTPAQNLAEKLTRPKKPKGKAAAAQGLATVKGPAYVGSAPMPEPVADPFASDADVCECHHRRGCHRAGTNECIRAEEVCDSGCLTFRLAPAEPAAEPTVEPAAAVAPAEPQDVPAAPEPRPAPVAVDDADLKPKAPADVDISKLGRCVREITVPLSVQENSTLGTRLADASQELTAHEAHMKSAASAMSKKKKELRAVVDELAKQIHERVKTVTVSCFKVPNIDADRMEIYTVDTRELVHTQPLTGPERTAARQRDLFTDLPMGAGTMPTGPIPVANECRECGHAERFHELKGRGKKKTTACTVDRCPCRGFLPLEGAAVLPFPAAVPPLPAEDLAQAAPEGVIPGQPAGGEA